MGSCRFAIGEDVEAVVREERRWNDRLFSQSNRTATTELMERERRRFGEVITEAARWPEGKCRTETEVKWRRSACGGIRLTCEKCCFKIIQDMIDTVFNI